MKRLHLVCGAILRIRQVHGHGHYAMRRKARIHSPQPQKALQHQTRPREQDERKGHLGDRQCASYPFSSANHATCGLTQRFARAMTCGSEGRRQPEHHACDNRKTKREGQHPPIDSNHFHPGDFSRRRQSHQCPNTPEGQQDSSRAARQ